MVKRNEWVKARREYLKTQPKNHEGYYVCNTCDHWIMYPEVDHILKRSTHPHLALEPSNFQMLCYKCHANKHA